MVAVLSIQSHVAYGHVGNSSAVFPLQRLGIEVWPVHTVQFSNHTGYGEWTGRVFDGQAIEEVVQGIADRGVLGRCDAVLSGYLGSADIGHAVVGTVQKVRAANPGAVYCCDPVIGDVGRGVFVRPGIAEFMRDVAVPAADVVTPNHYELDLLAGATHRVDRVGDRRGRRRAGPRPAGGADDVAGRRGHPRRRGRPAGVGGRPALPRADAPARRVGQRGRRRDRGAVPGALARHGVGGRGAGPGRCLGLRPARRGPRPPGRGRSCWSTPRRSSWPRRRTFEVTEV